MRAVLRWLLDGDPSTRGQVMRALDHLRRAGVTPDERATDVR